MWQAGPRISCPPILSWLPTPDTSPPQPVPFWCYRKNNYKNIRPSTSLFLGGTNIFPPSLVVPKYPTPLLGRDTLTKLETTLMMGSFSAPRALQLLITIEEAITPSPIGRGQKLREDKINSQVWDQGTPGWAHHDKLNWSSLSSEIPLGFQTRNNTPSEENLRKGYSL